VRVGQRHIVELLLVVLALLVAGCQSGSKEPGWPSSQELRVEQRVGGQAVDLKADEIVRVMRRIGLADSQIYNLGPSLYGALRSTGAAAITSGGQPEVVMAVNEEHLFVQSRSQSIFVYDIKEKKFIPVPPMPAQIQ